MKYYDYGACMNKDDTILQCVFSTHLTNLYCILVCQWLNRTYDLIDGKEVDLLQFIIKWCHQLLEQSISDNKNINPKLSHMKEMHISW